MFQRKFAKDYNKILAKKYNIEENDVKKIVHYALKQIQIFMRKGYDIHIPFFGRLTIKKKK